MLKPIALKRLKNSAQRILYFSMLAVQTMGADVKHGAGLDQLSMSSHWTRLSKDQANVHRLAHSAISSWRSAHVWHTHSASQSGFMCLKGPLTLRGPL